MKKLLLGRMAYRLFKDDAKSLLTNKDKTKQAVINADRKAENNKSVLKSVWSQFKLMLEMLDSYRKGEYTSTPKRTLVMIAAGILYFISPIDLVPDFLFGIGLIDDAAVLAFLAKQVKKDIDAYESWKNQKDLTLDHK